MGKKDTKKVPGAPVTRDERFSSIHNDPRFKLPKKDSFKVKLDERFSKEEFTGSKRAPKVDRYGRKVKKSENDDFDKYYVKEDEDKDKPAESEPESDEEDDEEQVIKTPKGILKKKVEEDEKDSASEESESESDAEPGILDRARGEGFGSSDSDSSSSESDSSDEFESESEIELEDEKPDEGDPSSTIAVVNMDWDNIKSVDLLATFTSFVPSGGRIESISIYPSEFGKERMQKEEIEGPPRDLFKKKSKKDEDSDSDSDSEVDASNLEAAAKKLYEEDDGEHDYDPKALRRYQLQRLRYYYAVVKCDSVKTAQSIYVNCDGTEFESTSNLFDLRYVPEGMEFEDKPRDTCDKIPANYKPNNFVTDALQHSKVKLTWDETPVERTRIAQRAFSQKEIDEMDFKAYLASGSDEEEQDMDMKNKYKDLVGSKSIFHKKENDEDDDVDVEFTFNPSGDKKSSETAQEEESTIDKVKRKEKERRKRRLDKLKEKQQEEEQQKKEATAATKNKNNKKKAAVEEDAKKKAELELVMMDEEKSDEHGKHFNMKEIIKSEKQKNKKGKHKNKDAIIEDNFEADLNDPRFQEVFENHEFAIDPTRPEFQKTEVMTKILKERSNRNKGNKGKQDAKKRKREEHSDSTGNLDGLVERIKRKSKN